MRVCDDYIVEQIRQSKSESLQLCGCHPWFSQMAEIESYAPMMAYLVRSMQSGGELAKTFWQRMIDNAEEYLEEGVARAPSNPAATRKPGPSSSA